MRPAIGATRASVRLPVRISLPVTTMAALMGTLPIALGVGAGAESRRPLGIAVVGGLVFSQTLTLYVTPVFYLYMERLQEWMRGRKADRVVATGEAGEMTAAR